MGGIVERLIKELRLLGGTAPRRSKGDYAAFDRIDGATLDYREFRRSASLCSHPSLVTDFAETEAGCAYSWAPADLSANS